MRVEMAAVLEASTAVVNTAMSSVISTNIILSVVLGVSMKKLWMMISSLQIIINYPLLKIPMPSNFLQILSSLVDIVNLGLIPK